MRLSDFGRDAVAICAAAAMLAGCGGSQPPFGAPDAMPRTSTLTTRVEHGRSWVLPEAQSEDLLYISNEDAVDIVTYPQGTFVGTLTGFGVAQGLCVDKAGNVFITNSGGQSSSEGYIAEYAHGKGSPIKKLRDEYAPIDCSVDPTTGNLAVTNNFTVDGGASVLVFAKAKGVPRKYNDSKFLAAEFCGYDSHGNLFVDASGFSSPSFAFAELPRGGSGLKNIALSRNIDNPGGVQWDGKYIAIGDFGTGTLYRATSTGKVAGTVTLDSGVYVNQFWIQDSTIIGPDLAGYSGRGNVRFWKYPAGGFPTKTLSKFQEPFGVAVSLAPK